jgi:ketosteroid isomerase-like protein
MDPMRYSRLRLSASWCAAVAILLLGSTSLRAIEYSSDIDRQLRTLEAELATALSSVDVDKLSQLWADDFVSTMADGHVITGKARLKALRAKKPDAASRLTNDNQKIEIQAHGDWAVVLVTSSWLAAGKPVGEPYQATHIWAKHGGRWKLIAAHISEVKP